MSNDKFIQPIEGIEVVSRSRGPRTLLTPEVIEAAKARIALGEDATTVAEELAAKELELERSLESL